jgi:hypothetical protein
VLNLACSIAVCGEDCTSICPPVITGLLLFDFWLFLRLKFGLKVHYFAFVEKVQQNMIAGTQPFEKRTSSGTSTSSRTDGAVGQ